MTRDPHCDGCKADDARDALRRERDELQARLDALGEPEVEIGYRLSPDDAADFIVDDDIILDRPHNVERDVYRSPWRPVSPETTP